MAGLGFQRLDGAHDGAERLVRGSRLPRELEGRRAASVVKDEYRGLQAFDELGEASSGEQVEVDVEELP
jgi:hypothetical protein